MVLLPWLIHHTSYFILTISLKKVPTIFFQRTKLPQIWFYFLIGWFFSILSDSWPELSTDAEYCVALQEQCFFSLQPWCKGTRAHTTGSIHNPVPRDNKRKTDLQILALLKSQITRIWLLKKEIRHDHVPALLFEDDFLPLITRWDHLWAGLQETQIPDYKDL